MDAVGAAGNQFPNAYTADVRAQEVGRAPIETTSVPFTERFFDLAHFEEDDGAGFVGMITANSFMKREFGKKLIETFVPRWDLTHVVDTSGAYIPGHGTPTVILFARNRESRTEKIRAVLGIRGL